MIFISHPLSCIVALLTLTASALPQVSCPAGQYEAGDGLCHPVRHIFHMSPKLNINNTVTVPAWNLPAEYVMKEQCYNSANVNVVLQMPAQHPASPPTRTSMPQLLGRLWNHPARRVHAVPALPPYALSVDIRPQQSMALDNL